MVDADVPNQLEVDAVVDRVVDLDRLLTLKTIAMNLLSLSATFGLLVRAFLEGHLRHLLGSDPTGDIEPNMPIMIVNRAAVPRVPGREPAVP